MIGWQSSTCRVAACVDVVAVHVKPCIQLFMPLSLQRRVNGRDDAFGFDGIFRNVTLQELQQCTNMALLNKSLAGKRDWLAGASAGSVRRITTQTGVASEPCAFEFILASQLHCFGFGRVYLKCDPLVVHSGNTLGVTFPEIRQNKITSQLVSPSIVAQLK